MIHTQNSFHKNINLRYWHHHHNAHSIYGLLLGSDRGQMVGEAVRRRQKRRDTTLSLRNGGCRRAAAMGRLLQLASDWIRSARGKVNSSAKLPLVTHTYTNTHTLTLS